MEHRPVDPPETNECKCCGEETNNGSMCEVCVEEQKADDVMD